jgi:hypothetical protein
MRRKPNHSVQSHFVYVFRDTFKKDHYKIGYTADDPSLRAAKEDWRLYGALGDTPKALKVESTWCFRSPFSAQYIEQGMIHMIRSLKFEEVDTDYNWFHIDSDSLHFVVKSLQPLVDAVMEQESCLYLYSYAPRLDKPYGQFRSA